MVPLTPLLLCCACRGCRRRCRVASPAAAGGGVRAVRAGAAVQPGSSLYSDHFSAHRADRAGRHRGALWSPDYLPHVYFSRSSHRCAAIPGWCAHGARRCQPGGRCAPGVRCIASRLTCPRTSVGCASIIGCSTGAAAACRCADLVAFLCGRGLPHDHCARRCSARRAG